MAYLDWTNFFYYLTMPSKIRLHDVVALMDGRPGDTFPHAQTAELLSRADRNRSSMLLEDSRFQVEFSDSDGRA